MRIDEKAPDHLVHATTASHPLCDRGVTAEPLAAMFGYLQKAVIPTLTAMTPRTSLTSSALFSLARPRSGRIVLLNNSGNVIRFSGDLSRNRKGD